MGGWRCPHARVVFKLSTQVRLNSVLGKESVTTRQVGRVIRFTLRTWRHVCSRSRLLGPRSRWAWGGLEDTWPRGLENYDYVH